MSFIKRTWQPHEADEWSKEDTIAIILSPLAYILLTIGTGLSFLLMPIGYITLALGLACTFLMIFVINPKLKVTSDEYEKKQKEYLEELEKKIKWED